MDHHSRRSSACTARSGEEASRFFDPELATLPSCVDLLRVLVGGEDPPVPIRIAAQHEELLLARFAYHRLLPQLRWAIAGDRFETTARLAERVETFSTRLALNGLQLEGMLLAVSQLFGDAGVEFLVLKGVATGRLDYPQPGWRQAADVDVLVRVADVERAGRALASGGFLRPDATSTLMDKGETWRAPAGVSLDLHTRPHTAGRSLSEDWWDRSDVFVIGGREFRALDRGGRMAHAASHFALSYPNHRIFSSLLDLVTISRLASAAERDRAEQFLAALGVRDIVHRITRRGSRLLDDPGIVLGSPQSRPLDLALRRAYDRPDLDKLSLKLAKTLGMPAASKRRVLRNWVAPSQDFLALGGYSSRWDRLAQVVSRQWDKTQARRPPSS